MGSIIPAALIPGRRTIVSTGRRGVGKAPTADVGVARADHAVVDFVVGLDVDGAPGLDDGGVALVAPDELGFGAQLGHFALGHADEAAHVRHQAAQVVGVVA